MSADYYSVATTYLLCFQSSDKFPLPSNGKGIPRPHQSEYAFFEFSMPRWLRTQIHHMLGAWRKVVNILRIRMHLFYSLQPQKSKMNFIMNFKVVKVIYWKKKI